MEVDHVHLHMVIPPKYAVADVVETLKQDTRRALRAQDASFLGKVYWDGGGMWSTGDFASTVGADEALVRRDRGDAGPGRRRTSAACMVVKVGTGKVCPKNKLALPSKHLVKLGHGEETGSGRE
jgi:hypothetical protein